MLVVIAILATILMPAASAMAARMERAKCMFNLKALFTGAEFYLQDREQWPQIPVTLLDNRDSDEYARQWIAALEPYKVSSKSWICPTVEKQVTVEQRAKAKEKVRIDYFPTPFDNKRITPHRWVTQPWFIERGAVHGSGNLIIYPDGSIKTLDDVITKRKKK